ncbi:galactose-3-O-sulfotransferase 2-like isoform X2 [Branchiostoma floridae]|nr:galactose-3-O-sulfotransferase 2-like isoform X2 [Branchiostoma floridae]XP_035668546.1 galactose-3-O-sulfotransferase 2-like isoform X2 [Branchiostoma floridae]
MPTRKKITPWTITLATVVVLLALSFIAMNMIEGRLTTLYTPQHHKMQISFCRIPAEGRQENKRATNDTRNTCSRPQQKYIFIAPHKVGASTTCTIFQRYAISRKLPMMIPVEGNILSWGVSPTEEEYIHTPDEQYDALMNHFTYNKTWLRSKFPANTAYISIIRDPSKQLRSAMNYYFLPKLLKIKSNNPFKTFLENPWKYQNLSEVHYEGFNVTWDPTRNFMSFDLGYPAEAAEDMERARRYVSELQADFTLVMLLDYFDESYVLLKRLMCWELRDILYVTKNNRSYSFKEYTPSEKELEELRRWKAVDYLLYDTFNKSLWEKIAAQGPDFYEEVEFLKDVNGRVNTYCKERQKETPNLVVETSKWNPSMFEVDADFCRVLQAKVRELLAPFQKENGSRRMLVSEKINMKAYISGQPTFKYDSEQKKYLDRLENSRMSNKTGSKN